MSSTPVALHHLTDGDPSAPGLLLASSLGTTSAMWDPDVPALAEHHHVIRFDHRGHGRSPVPDGPYALADLGGDVLALLDRLGVERVSACGLSMGGFLVQWLAIHAPERIDRLVVLCSAAHMPPPSTWEQRAALVREAGSTEPLADSVMERWFTPQFRADEPQRVAEVRAMVVATPAEGYASCCQALGATDLRPDLARVRAPTLVVSAAEDPGTPPEVGRVIADGIPGARFEVVPDAAHLVNFEQTATVDRLVLEHLAGERPPS